MKKTIKQLADEEKNNKKSENEKTKIQEHIFSAVLEDGSIAEMIYDPVEKKTSLVVGTGDKTGILEKVTTKEKDLLPLKPTNEMIKVGFIKFPSELGKYETNLELFNKIKAYIKKYCILPDDFVTIAALYIMMSWVHEIFHVLPYLRVVGMHGTGKTRFLEVVGNICYKPMFAGGSASTASIFRAVDQIKGTLVFDEADFKNSELWNEIVKILNSGHTKDFPALRMEATASGGFKMRTFYVFGPKILASRQRFGDEALESRCLTQNLLPHHSEIKVPIHLTEEFKKEALEIKNKLLAFRFANYNNPKLEAQDLEGINFPRLKQSLLAIINVAKLVDENIKKEVLAFAVDYEKELQMHQTRSMECDVLICILEILLKDQKDMEQEKGKIRIWQISIKYDSKFNSDFDDKDVKVYGSGDHAFVAQNYKVSARKVGDIVNRKLMIRTERDSDGFYIPASEHKKIHLLKGRYGITDDMLYDKEEEKKKYPIIGEL